MHITLYFKATERDFIRVPRANLHLFQSLLYNVFPPEHASFLHDEGYVVKGKHLKLFAMSWPISEKAPEFEERAIKFPSLVKLVISTPNRNLVDGITGSILRGERLRIGNNAVICSKVEAEQQVVTKNSVVVDTLSPVTCYGCLPCIMSIKSRVATAKFSLPSVLITLPRSRPRSYGATNSSVPRDATFPERILAGLRL